MSAWRVSVEALKKTVSMATALLWGTDVGKDRMQQRVEICGTCELVQQAGNLMKCSVCSCRLSGEAMLINLARYEETAGYGCKHPDGSKWKKAGV